MFVELKTILGLFFFVTTVVEFVAQIEHVSGLEACASILCYVVTRDVFRVLILHSPAAGAILKTCKTSPVPIYLKCTRVITIFYTNCT